MAKQRKLVDIEPADRLIRRFILALGWQKTRRFERRLCFNEQQGEITTVVWYESGVIGSGNRTDCFLQITLLGRNEDLLLCSGAVYAPRYQICSGFHPVKIPIEASVEVTAGDYVDWLGQTNVASKSARSDYRDRHPEVKGYSMTAINRYGPPYRVQLQQRTGRNLLVQRKSDRCRAVVGNRNL